MEERWKQSPLSGDDLIDVSSSSIDRRYFRSESSSSTGDHIQPELPARWLGSIVAMANFRDLGFTEDAEQLQCFMVEEIRKHSRNAQDYEHLYKMWSMAVNKYEKFGKKF